MGLVAPTYPIDLFWQGVSPKTPRVTPYWGITISISNLLGIVCPLPSQIQKRNTDNILIEPRIQVNVDQYRSDNCYILRDIHSFLVIFDVRSELC